MRRRILMAAAGTALALPARRAGAEEPVDVALVLAVDVSRSIDEDEARLAVPCGVRDHGSRACAAGF